MIIIYSDIHKTKLTFRFEQLFKFLIAQDPGSLHLHYTVFYLIIFHYDGVMGHGWGGFFILDYHHRLLCLTLDNTGLVYFPPDWYLSGSLKFR